MAFDTPGHGMFITIMLVLLPCLPLTRAMLRKLKP